MELEDKILAVLIDTGPLKAIQLATKINEIYGDSLDKKEINKALYYQLKGKVHQDNTYRWSIGPPKDTAQSIKKQIADTPLARLCSYYLECLSKDMEAGISTYATNKYGSPDYGQLTALPQFANAAVNIFAPKDVNNTIAKVRKDPNRMTLQLGYPIHLRKVTAKTLFYKVEPVFLIPFESQSFQNGGDPSLTNEVPRFNFEAVGNISKLEKNELFEEVITLSEELGLNNPPSEQPTFDEVILRLRQIRPEWSWVGTMNPEDITSQSLQKETMEGIYNAAAVFPVERSVYTQGLEKELDKLRQLQDSQYKQTALGEWISAQFPAIQQQNIDLIEPLLSNYEQRQAVKRALQAPITVITGPPGTGKSQVVTSIIINATYRGQTVLFASKNHKAVDVVYERVNGLIASPVMLRLGGDDLQAKLAAYLSGLLASNTTQTNHEQFDASKKKHEELSKQITEINDQQTIVVNLRNRIDQLEQNIEKYRKSFGGELFSRFKDFDESLFKQIDLFIKNFEVALRRANKTRQPFFIRLIWFMIRSSRIEKANSDFQILKNHGPVFGVQSTQIPLNEKSLEVYLQLAKEYRERLEWAKQVCEYFKALNDLRNQKNLFQLSLEAKQVENEMANVSLELWENWRKLLPDKLTKENRKDIGDYVALLNLIVAANAKNNKPNVVWNRFYSLQEKVTNILSCWAITSLSVSGRVPFQPGFFDLVIIDEASQCDIASVLPLLYRAKRAVIIGDSKQLTHISAIDENQDIQLLEKYQLEKDFLSWSYVGHSLFGLAQTLCSSQDIVVLRDHHRSHSDIITFSNRAFYDGNLRIATKYENLKFIPDKPVLRWIDIAGAVQTPLVGGGSLNVREADSVVLELKRLIHSGYKGTIGVVSPFRAQANRIRDIVHKDQTLSNHLLLRDFLVDTVHKFQGDERDVMIFSPVISDGMGKGSRMFIARTGNLFNVAITRARASLIVVGDKGACSSCGIKYMEDFVDYIAKIEVKDHPRSAQNILADYGPKYPSVSSSAVVSDWEKRFYEALYANGIRTLPQYQVEQYALDLALIQDGRKLDIEIDGERYHKAWDGELCRRDQIRNMRLIELGWDVLRFWVYEVRDDLKGCIERVHAWADREKKSEKKGLFDNVNQSSAGVKKVVAGHQGIEIETLRTKQSRQGIVRCMFCGGPAIPGENVCYQCKSD